MDTDTAGMNVADKDALTFGAIGGVVTLFVCWVWEQFDDSTMSPEEAHDIIWNGASDRFWFVDHPFWAALIVFAVVTVGFRLYTVMRHLEDR